MEENEKNINNIPDQKAYKPIAINNLPDQKKYKGMCLTPFKFMMMNQFPFIEDSLQEMDNYSLLCQIVNILSTVTENVSNMEYNVTGLYNAYVELMNYVNKYFDNLDVQEEVNTKLDQMATDGTLDNIINHKIFDELNTEVTNNTADIATAQADILINKNNITNLENSVNNILNKFTIFLGDSYILGTDGKGGTIDGWAKYFVDHTNLQPNEYQIIGESGGGFVQKGSSSNSNFQEALSNGFTGDKEKVKYIVIAGGYNDSKQDTYTQEIIETAISNFMSYVNQNFPNAHVYLGMVGADGAFTDTAMKRRYNMQVNVLPAYNKINIYGGFYLNNSEFILKSNYINNFAQDGDKHHPNAQGYNLLGTKLYEAFLYGSCNVVSTTQFNLPNTTEEDNPVPVTAFFNNGNITLYLDKEFLFVNNVTFNYNEELVLSTMEASTVIRPIYENMYYPVYLTARSTDLNKFTRVHGNFVFHGNSVNFGVIQRNVLNNQSGTDAQLIIPECNNVRWDFKLNLNFNSNIC